MLKVLVDNNVAHFADAGGFVSPMGISYIGASKEKLGEAACCAVKRIILDNRVAKAAARYELLCLACVLRGEAFFV